MADETIIETVPPAETRSEERIKQLSGKLETTAQERDTEKTQREEAERRATFAEGFVDIVATQPLAKDHKDEIKEKVLKGYSVQDATYAVLGGLGKLGGNTPAPTPQVAGGSADTSPTGGQKELKDMTMTEKREALGKIIGWD